MQVIRSVVNCNITVVVVIQSVIISSTPSRPFFHFTVVITAPSWLGAQDKLIKVSQIRPNVAGGPDMIRHISTRRGLSGFVGVCQGLLGFVGVCRDMSGFVGICRGLSGYVGVCRDMSGCVVVCRGVSGFVGICRDMSGCVGVCRGLKLLGKLT